MSNNAPHEHQAEMPVTSDSRQDGARAHQSLIVLSQDAVLIQALETVEPEHAIAVIDSEDDLPSRLIGSEAGVAILDAAATATPIAQLTESLRAQFPDLVLIVAGDSADQAALSPQVQSGAVHRFLHKPVSAQRVRLFVGAAWRRHDEERAGHQAATARGQIGKVSLAPAEPRLGRRWLYLGGAVLTALLALMLWLALRPSTLPQDSATMAAAAGDPRSAARQDPVLLQLLAQAETAFERGDLVSPPGRNATELYRRALERDATSTRARAGIDRVLAQLLATAEKALASKRTDEAARLVDAARAVQPDDARVVFLAAQIAKELERALLTRAREAAQGGDLGRALEVLDNAPQSGRRSTVVVETRQELRQQQIDDRVSEFLKLAEVRARNGALLEPARDNAVFLVEAAAAIAPNDPQVSRARRELARRLLSQARNALTGARPEDGERWVTAARSVGASEEEIAALRREAQNVRIAVQAEAMARTSQLFNQRLAQGSLLEPAYDSAEFYLSQLEHTDANHPSTQLARQALTAKLLAEARSAVTRRDLSAARSWVAAARRLDADAAQAAAIERDIEKAQGPAASDTRIVSATELERTRYVAPQYPAAALSRNRTGWVELEFTVRADGSVTDVVVVQSEPVKIFDQAAIEALRKWHYRPVLLDGRPIDQRARLRVRFALE